MSNEWWCDLCSISLVNNFFFSNGNRTEWSPIRSVIIRVINKIGRPRSGSPICLITSMITDRIGGHEVLLSINHNFNKICIIIESFNKEDTLSDIINAFFPLVSRKYFLHETSYLMYRNLLTKWKHLLI